MAARKRLLQLAIAAVNLIIVVLVFTSIWPFPSGDFKVHLPSANEISWTYSDGTVHVTAPFTIDNGWIYDVDDLAITYSVTNESRALLAEGILPVPTIPAGTITSSQLDFTFDLLDLYDSGIDWMIFHEDMLYFSLEVTCFYTMKLVKFDASYQVSVEWDALVQGYGISNVDYPTTLPAPGEPISVSVSYWLHTSDLLRSLPAAQVTVSFYGETTLLGQAQTTIQLGSNYSGVLALEVIPGLYSSYSAVLQFQFGGLTFSERVVI